MRDVRPIIRSIGATLVLVACLLVSACLKSTEPQPSVLQLDGRWSFTGVQTGPVRETLSGTLTISRESGSSFQGRLDLVAVNSQTCALSGYLPEQLVDSPSRCSSLRICAPST